MDQQQTVVVGYTPTKYGQAAANAAIEEARRRDALLHVLNVSRGDAHVDRNLAQSDDLATLAQSLNESGVRHRLVQQVGRGEPAEEILRAVEETDAGARWASCCSAAPPSRSSSKSSAPSWPSRHDNEDRANKGPTRTRDVNATILGP
jgi:hypothetical protein